MINYSEIKFVNPGVLIADIPKDVYSVLDVFFVYEDKVYSMLPGKLYKVQNNYYHTFVNAGPEPIVHITFEDL